MRLTLRTLLAWLDDTLPPAEVRQIGQQVSETPLAQELVDRIHRVTRQRRLTVPSGSGPDGVDPAVVAAYIDDGLEPDEVIEFEKRCLVSDVHLAEVASVHQVLSLLSQKAKVPPEARQRMYQLLRGRETATSAEAAAAARPRKPAARLEPEVAPAVAWAPQPNSRTTWMERFGPVAIVAGLVVILSWSAFMSIPRESKSPMIQIAQTPPPAEPVAAPKLPEVAKPEVAAVEPPPDKPEEPATEPEKGVAEVPDPAPKAVAAGLSTLPPGSVGVVGGLDGVLLRYNLDSRNWEKLAPQTSLREGDRLVNLPPFTAPVQIGAAKVTMIGDGELSPQPAGLGTAARLDLKRGAIRIVGTSSEPIALPFDAGVVRVTAPLGSVLGVERINTRAPGDKLPSAPALRFSVAEGDVTLEAGQAKETLSAGSTLIFQAPDHFTAKASEGVPTWVSDPTLSAATQERGRTLARYFKSADRQPKACIVEAMSDERPEVRQDAIAAYGGIGSLDLIVATLSTPEDAAVRKAAAKALRDVAARDADSARALRASLEQTGGTKAWADLVENLLVGFPPKEVAEEPFPTKLVNLLKHEDVGVRELAIDALQKFSRRGDRLGYDPDKPQEGNGLKAWQDLVQRNEVRPAAKAK